jgi:hypothetical protein
MPDRSPATDRGNRAETADGGYFASLAQGRYLLVTTFRPKGAPVSARVQGVVEGDRAWFRVRSRSGTYRYLHGTDRVQVPGQLRAAAVRGGTAAGRRGGQLGR